MDLIKKGLLNKKHYMKKFFLLILTLGLATGANAQNLLPIPSYHLYSLDSTMHLHMNDSLPYSNSTRFVKRVSDTTFISCVKENDSIYRFHLLTKTFNVLKSIRVTSNFKNISDIFVDDNLLYIADNYNDRVYIKKVSLNSLFYSTGSSISYQESSFIPSLKRIDKIHVYDSVNVKVIVGIGVDNQNYSVLIKHYRALAPLSGTVFQEQFNYNILRATNQNEFFKDITVTDNYIIVLSTSNNYFTVRRFNKFGNLILTQNINTYSVTDLYYPSKIENLYADNIAIGGMFIKNNNYSDMLMFYDGNLSYFLKNYYYVPQQVKTSLTDLEYANQDTSLYVLRYASDSLNLSYIQPVSKIYIPNLNNMTSAPERIYGGSGSIDDICVLSSRYILGIGSEDNEVHYFKGSCNFKSKIVTDCDYPYIRGLIPYNNVYFQSSLAPLNNLIYSRSIIPIAFKYINQFYYYTPISYRECTPCLDCDTNNIFNPNQFKSLTKETGSDKDISIYPNPASDNVIIESLYDIEKIEIYNVMGQKVYDSAVNSKSININVSNFISGTYMTKTYTKGGLFTKKIVVE